MQGIPYILSHSRLLVAVSCCLVTIFPRRSETDPALQHLFTTLAAFLSRGQAVIECLSPLPFLLEAHVSLHTLRYLNCVVGGTQSAMASWSMIRFLAKSERSVTQLWLQIGPVCVIFLFSTIYSFETQVPTSAIDVAAGIGDFCLVLAILTIHHDTRSSWIRSIVPELALVTSFMLGYHGREWVLACLVLTANHCLHGWEQISDRSKSLLSHTISATLQILLKATICSVVTLTIFIMTYPASETSAGGNWNLRYLPASVRRALRGTTEPLGTTSISQATAIPRHALIPDAMISLYVQGAGFLYTDDWTWDNSMGVYRPLFENEGVDLTLSRAVFRDSMIYTGPWLVEPIAKAKGKDKYKVRDLVSYFSSGDSVRLRSKQSEKLLAVELGVPSIIDQLHFLDVDKLLKEEESGVRWRISMTSQAVDASIWTLTYSPNESSSFRLFNNRAGCFLGTSYRSFPDWDGLWASDDILKGLRLDLEVTCLRNAASVASTFSVVEGYREYGNLQQVAHPNSNLVGRFWFQYEMIKARAQLSYFRNNFGFLQDTPSSLTNTRPVPYPRFPYWLDFAIPGVFLAINLCEIACEKRALAAARRDSMTWNSKRRLDATIGAVMLYLVWSCILQSSQLSGSMVFILISLTIGEQI